MLVELPDRSGSASAARLVARAGASQDPWVSLAFLGLPGVSWASRQHLAEGTQNARRTQQRLGRRRAVSTDHDAHPWGILWQDHVG